MFALIFCIINYTGILENRFLLIFEELNSP
jgi:hypothetical protein